MNKSDLIAQLVDSHNMTRADAEEAVDTVFGLITKALVEDNRVEIRGFGSFVSKHYRARAGRNPRTGETIQVPAKRLPTFKVGKELKNRLEQG